ncbi:MAG: hypothetical protein OHK0012_23110 [Synechococcales cyanobacterium]
MGRLNQKLLRILILGWLGFALAGMGLYTFTTPHPVLLIERSYCPPTQWQQVVTQYAAIYQRAQRRQIRLQRVILFSSLGEEIRDTPPTPAQLQSLATYGRPDPQRQTTLQGQYPQSILLTCATP